MAHIDTLFQRPDRVRKPLHVVTTIFNSARYRSRWKHYEDFVRMCMDAGIELTVVEVIFGERDSVLDKLEPQPHRLVQLRTNHEFFLKENAINLGVQRLPADWKYVAWVDADITFARADWADETIQQLQHYQVVQMWSEAADMNSKHELMFHWKSLMNVRRMGLPTTPPGNQSGYYYMDAKRLSPYPHAGYAWAARREAWDGMGGLFDKAILGAADWHMAHGMLGQIEHTISKGYHPRYQKVIRDWALRADKAIKRNIGMVEGLVIHHWHGPKVARQYQTRNNILIKAQFNPDVDIYRDWQGLYQLSDRSIILRDETREYLRSRQEDAI